MKFDNLKMRIFPYKVFNKKYVKILSAKRQPFWSKRQCDIFSHFLYHLPHYSFPWCPTMASPCVAYSYTPVALRLMISSWHHNPVYIRFMGRWLALVKLVSRKMLCVLLLKIESFHDANFAVTGGTEGCRCDNLRCHQWRQSWHHRDSRVSGITYRIYKKKISLYPKNMFC